jgi:hypothetical protein
MTKESKIKSAKTVANDRIYFDRRMYMGLL